jgi:hypothetical protein
MEMGRGMLLLLCPLLIALTVLMSLGWTVLAVLAGWGWVGKRLLRAMSRGVHKY